MVGEVDNVLKTIPGNVDQFVHHSTVDSVDMILSGYEMPCQLIHSVWPGWFSIYGGSGWVYLESSVSEGL